MNYFSSKIGIIDKDHLNFTVKDLQSNTAYRFKIDNRLSSSNDDQSNIIQEFKFETASGKIQQNITKNIERFSSISVKQYDPSLFLEKIQRSLENVVNNVMKVGKLYL